MLLQEQLLQAKGHPAMPKTTITEESKTPPSPKSEDGSVKVGDMDGASQHEFITGLKDPNNVKSAG